MRSSAAREAATLIREFKRIKEGHSKALRHRAARAVLGPSVIRVFRPKTKQRLLSTLIVADVDALSDLTSQEEFRTWFERELGKVGRAIRKDNGGHTRIMPGYRWGHATKVLCLYAREVVTLGYFDPRTAKRISKWLYVPIDSLVIKRLRELKVRLEFRKIKEIDSADKFYSVQEQLGFAASKVNVPRIWFDDVWGVRE